MIVARAPLRIPLGGGGTDLQSYYSRSGGFIIAAAINKYVYVCANRPSADDLIRLKYSRSEKVARLEEIQHDLVRPAFEWLGIDRNIEVSSMADVPAGTGMGSSSAYLVALLAALHELQRRHIDTHSLAELSCHIEIDLAGHAAGKQDHYVAAFGGVVALEIKPDGTVDVEDVAMSETTREELRNNMLLFFTGVTRRADDILRAQKEQTLRQDPTVLRSLDDVKELGYRIRDALESGDLTAFGELMKAHWEHKKRRSNAISSERLDAWYELGLRNGAVGGKVIGAGGGGFLLFYCTAPDREKLRAAMKEAGLREMAFDFDPFGARTMVHL